MFSVSLSQTSAQILEPPGVARANANSALRVSFFSDVDLLFSLSGSVDCSGSCTSFVQLYGPDDVLLFDATTVSGAQSGSVQGVLLANQSYFLWARTDVVAARTATSGVAFDAATGSWDLTLSFGTTGGLPEPAASGLLVIAALGLTLRGTRALRRSSPPHGRR
ncbi:MAG: hypothetical protein FJ091_01310 [Deltaproteobacteria bacterium]|nr:hypothetical protein [Deltaproteobacteria bacterium]